MCKSPVIYAVIVDPGVDFLVVGEPAQFLVRNVCN